MPADGPRLVPADGLRAAAEAVLAAERARLAPLLPPHELLLTGGCSVPGALTKGDVDLHLRVGPADFAAAVAVLRTLYPVVLPEIWQPTLATFAVPAALPAGLAATPAGSAHDVRFTTTWRALRADPALLAQYNALKLDPAPGYEQRKSAFFDRVSG
ncbi:GrpB family protein [Spirilliplanes yamanashiensis]|uniref:GrpB family protein n=1 Tax=Spirilliplanes yamanashiensis TaxID=42233 RepID=A0A8J4DL53_9ACTN|nr:GrpB family protein [Spirilliplanes yamanashiensis]MDP9818079.1 GrpB-like predicted nucleotidyltransferase (UPF0157 family) [Spirilliplanes yamanashiensis]GIJ04889.1 hypothetical protein Sya03_42410 [Spirilliplanes yamanashiensis]